MRVAVGADHRGYELKTSLAARLRDDGYEVVDCGTHNGDSVDYPDYAEAVGREVAAGRADLGLLVCGSGVGVAIAANKIPGVRAANVTSEPAAALARRHNDANVLCLGAGVVGSAEAEKILDSFLDSEFEGGRHATRVEKIARLEDHAIEDGGIEEDIEDQV